jgi:hypothetical protein
MEGLMRMRAVSFIGLTLAGLTLALGTVFCSAASPPPLGKCCVLTASDGTIDCYCGNATQGAVVSTVVVSGSTCTVTFTSDEAGTSDGGGGGQLTGYPPAAITDCTNLIGN